MGNKYKLQKKKLLEGRGKSDLAREEAEENIPYAKANWCNFWQKT